jgi:hypothetical protein
LLYWQFAYVIYTSIYIYSHTLMAFRALIMHDVCKLILDLLFSPHDIGSDFFLSTLWTIFDNVQDCVCRDLALAGLHWFILNFSCGLRYFLINLWKYLHNINQLKILISWWQDILYIFDDKFWRVDEQSFLNIVNR